VVNSSLPRAISAGSAAWLRRYRIAHARVPCILQMPGQAAGAHGGQRVLQHCFVAQGGAQLVHHAARCRKALAPA